MISYLFKNLLFTYLAKGERNVVANVTLSYLYK